ncbi:M48 family metallopeptidase [Oceanivirga miroungae]|uniref:YgjP-like metallopeptidase domain-containing protein n=1 Tax=Oceanivirga miroungae TaxID=1130046 RepID=A0A6I8MDU6_9FUSO|nr:SprT family zinc-dependent metalloprotease [Oceanivirga miroungae]VWL85261.1 hypothetical protein OMES3154_00544 [Oceanivirga miroungae]
MENKSLILGYTVVRKKIKNINLRIDSNLNVYISAPLNLDDYQIEKFIISKKAWIDKNIKRFSDYKDINKNLDTYENDSYIFFYGGKYRLVLKIGEKNIEFNDDDIVITNKIIDKESIKKIIYTDLYYPKARKLFVKRLDYYLELMSEKKDINLKISNIKSKWGLCIPQKREIRLNIDLMKKSIEEIDSVVVHEVAHLKHPNHSKNFYNEIDKYFKNYKEVNKKLNSRI